VRDRGGDAGVLVLRYPIGGQSSVDLPVAAMTPEQRDEVTRLIAGRGLLRVPA
jgi:hypothetical protein